MNSYVLEQIATEVNFDEAAYLLANPDVAKAVKKGGVASGRSHFDVFGVTEGRKLRFPYSTIMEAKQKKLERIKPFLRTDMKFLKTDYCYDFLTEELRSQFNIVDTDNVSSHSYDKYGLDLITQHERGLVLDCGAGKRPVYFDNVLNFEIVDYDTTDVRGVGEALPFIDNSFDAVLSIAVLEHVKDPFACAREIARVLKPGGNLMCCVPFLQPLHGYPHHYYNMSHQGLTNLFDGLVEVDKTDVYRTILPIGALTWIIRNWAQGLKGEAKDEFLNLRLSELMESGDKYLDRRFVTELPQEKNFELACATVLFAHKKGEG